MAITKRWMNKKTVSSIEKVPVIHIGTEMDSVYLVQYNTGECEVVSIDKNDFRNRALIEGSKHMNDELKALTYIYDDNTRNIEGVLQAKHDEYVLVKKIAVDKDGTRTRKEHYTAINYKGLEQARIALYDVIGRLVTSNPHHMNCDRDRFTKGDLHTALFIEADEIMCCSAYTRERKVNKIYYLTHFVNSSSTIRSIFKIEEVYDRDISDECEIISERDKRCFYDFHRYGIINDTELYILILKSRGYREGYIATCMGCNAKTIFSILDDIKKKICQKGLMM